MCQPRTVVKYKGSISTGMSCGSIPAGHAPWGESCNNAHMVLTDNPMLDRLARLETEYGKLTPEKGDEEGGQKKKAEDGEAEEDEPIEEDEDDFQDDDDYYQVTAW